MLRLALLGKNISHSQSPRMYRELISAPFHYSLLDYEKENDIPPLDFLMTHLDGLNITSPYKQHFLSDVVLTPEAKKCQAINCLKKSHDQFIGHNTDYLAIQDLLGELEFERVVLLGDGVMGKITLNILSDLKIKCDHFSRRITPLFNELDFKKMFNNERLLIINTCARDYIYKGELAPSAIFWDYNYSSEKMSFHLSSQCSYLDGLALLQRQAWYAVKFWSEL